jgi:hypothetical protein
MYLSTVLLLSVIDLTSFSPCVAEVDSVILISAHANCAG